MTNLIFRLFVLFQVITEAPEAKTKAQRAAPPLQAWAVPSVIVIGCEQDKNSKLLRTCASRGYAVHKADLLLRAILLSKIDTQSDLYVCFYQNIITYVRFSVLMYVCVLSV